MSVFDLENMAEAEIIATYILEERGIGFCLAYDEYRIIRTWLNTAGDVCRVLSILDGLREKIRPAPGKRPKKLKYLDKEVRELLKSDI